MTTEHSDSLPNDSKTPRPAQTPAGDSHPVVPGIPMAVPVRPDYAGAPSPDSTQPLGFWATIGLSAAVMLVFIVAQSVPFVTALVLKTDLNFGDPATRDEVMKLANNGQILCWCTIASTICCTVFLMLVLRVLGRSFRRYLALDIPPRRTVLRWLLILIVFMIAEESLNRALGIDTVHESMVAAYETAGSFALLLLGIAVLAPFEEELIIRGFMYRGIAASRVGVTIAIILPSVLWSVIHVQYDSFILWQVFLFGILLGIARYRTGSTTVPIILHAFNNFVATIQVAVMVEYFGRTSG